jgi:5'-phosphate synthase pdxT subunit
MNVGVLALQGDFREHRQMLEKLGACVSEVRLPQQLDGLSALIIPGGESTTIGMLATRFGLMQPLQTFAQERPVWGTCAGAIFLSRDARRRQPLLGQMDIVVERNAFGRQVDSFEVELSIPVLADGQRPFHAVFIRAPLIKSTGPQVEILARLPGAHNEAGDIVAARQGHLLATSFHPELTTDDRLHRYFLGMADA